MSAIRLISLIFGAAMILGSFAFATGGFGLGKATDIDEDDIWK